MITLKLMNPDEFQTYFKSAIESYAKEKVLSKNWHERESFSKAREEYERLLPKGEKTEHNYLYSILEGDREIGVVWLEQKTTENGFIRDIRILESYQGLGYGKEAMKQIEVEGKRFGLKKIGLHVFGHNKVARGLYEKLGYQTTNVMMIKEI